MPPQSHEEIIKEFAKMAGNLGGNHAQQPKWKTITKTVAVYALKNALAVAAVVVLTLVGWVFLNAAHEVGIIPWNITVWQAIRLIGPPLLFIICVPLTLTVKLKQ